MELYIWFFITLSANILILNFSCFFKQLPPFPCRFNFYNAPLLQEVQAPGLKFIWKKQFSMFFSLPRLYLTLTTIKTSEFSTLGRCFLKRVRFRYVTNHLKRRHYRVCSPTVSTVGMINHESGRFCETSYLYFGHQNIIFVHLLTKCNGKFYWIRFMFFSCNVSGNTLFLRRCFLCYICNTFSG